MKNEAESWNLRIQQNLLMPWRGSTKLTAPRVRSGDFEYLNAKIASGLERIINGDCNRKVLKEEDNDNDNDTLAHSEKIPNISQKPGPTDMSDGVMTQ